MSDSQIPFHLTTEPGFFAAVGEPSSVLQVANLLKTPGIATSRLGDELAQCLPDYGGAHLALSLRALAQRIRELFAHSELVRVGADTAYLVVTTRELHLPRVENARGSFSVEKATTSGGSVAVEIAGTGGGIEAELNFESVASYEASGKCLAFDHSILTRWDLMELRREGEEPLRFPQLRAIDMVTRESVGPISDDRCVHPVPVAAERKELVLTQEGLGKTRQQLKVVGGKSTELKLGLELPGLGIEAGVTLVQKSKRAVSYEYRLPPGHRYLAFREGAWTSWAWKVDGAVDS